FGGLWTFNRMSSRVDQASLSKTPQPVEKSVVALELDNGETVATFFGISAATAFEALSATAAEHGIALTTTQYDFGIFVEEIGDKKSTAERSWIYFVNGIAGTTAADKQPVATGDVVSFRYVVPSE
ncbi:MAG: DUF4430 domain-containing protein, partial [bacterium]|nr:DUF4430 domain-containing protein [bacterium]